LQGKRIVIIIITIRILSRLIIMSLIGIAISSTPKGAVFVCRRASTIERGWYLGEIDFGC
jgi:hypothetical protein